MMDTALKALLEDFAQEAGVSHRRLRTLVKGSGFRLPVLKEGERADPYAILALCQPVMEGLSEAPAEGWLSAIYQALTEGLFPIPEKRRSLQFQQAMGFFLSIFEQAMAGEHCPFDPLTDLSPLRQEELQESRIASEYMRFSACVRESHLLSLLRIGRAIQPFDPASHTIGVYHVALHTARQAAMAGLPVDLALTSAAALSHDIGKFGCRGADALRVPYLHYYFTFAWLSYNGLDDIAHVAANHSTWDLEFENLPIESLILIYADFCVRGTRGETGLEQVRIFSLEEAYEAIFKKLSDMTEEKQKRYLSVYLKLRDFERYLIEKGVNVDPQDNSPLPLASLDAALLCPEDSLKALCGLIFDSNVRLMHTIASSDSFGQLLEQARDEKNLQRIRSYLALFEEYSTHMTRTHKLLTLAFLYELLMHHEGDVRRNAGRVMGKLLANSGPRYRKEIPENAPQSAIAPAMHDILRESNALWEQHIEQCLHPDHKISQKHTQRISNSLKTIAESLFASCLPEEQARYFLPLCTQILTMSQADRFVLMDTLLHVPVGMSSDEQALMLIEALGSVLHEENEEIQVRLCAFRCLEVFLQRDTLRSAVRSALQDLPSVLDFACAYQRNRVHRLAGLPVTPLPPYTISEIFLNNLKSSVHFTTKLVHIEWLCGYAAAHPEDAFHIATHLSNVLSVSEHLPVRERAGRGILEIAPYLSIAQCNEVVIDLLRELEVGQNDIANYIPPYAGLLICRLPQKELEECVSFLEDLIRGANMRSARTALSTIGVMLSNRLQNGLDEAALPFVERLFGLLLTGVAHYDNSIRQMALTVLCKDFFANQAVPLTARRTCFLRMGKKLHTLLNESREGQLLFFHQSAMLNHLYRFLCEVQVEGGGFAFPAQRPAAFFPGTFDPFSAGHKRIIQEIRNQGFEVYLAIDEFSWSKKTLPKLLRRQIASMSVADQWDVYLFPDDIPVNIAIPEDLELLRSLFSGRDMYIVAGSDVILNASAYTVEAPGAAACYDHIVFLRIDENRAVLDDHKVQDILKGKLIMLSLPAYYESASSTQIREYIDKDLDIAMLVDPVVQEFIYSQGLYLREPQYKRQIAAHALSFKFQKKADTYTVRLCERVASGAELGRVSGKTLSIPGLYEALGSMEAAEQVRLCTSGKILLLQKPLTPSQDAERVLLPLCNELLARSLASDHTYAIYRAEPGDSMPPLLEQMGFLPVPGQADVLYVDMRSPMVIILDAFERIKEPLHSDPSVIEAVLKTRPKLRCALCSLFPGKLLLAFDAELLNDALLDKVQSCNGVLDVPAGERRLGPCMCVPYGKVLSGVTVPNTVTKALHADKRFFADLSGFGITEFPGYSQLLNQVRTLKSFRRPVLLVDDLLHNGYRMEKLDPLFKEEGVEIARILVGILSGRGRDLMLRQDRKVEFQYFIPNLLYWFNESLLYPFLGGDSVEGGSQTLSLLPSINLILPYKYPHYLHGATEASVRHLSAVALENAYDIVSCLEQRYQKLFSTSLTLKRLGEVFHWPRLPDKGRHLQYDTRMPASAYIGDDIQLLMRISGKET